MASPPGLSTLVRRLDPFEVLPFAWLEEWTTKDVEARLRDVRRDLASHDPVRARSALAGILGRVTVVARQGSWSNDWTLEMEARPLGMLPTVAPRMVAGARNASQRTALPQRRRSWSRG